MQTIRIAKKLVNLTCGGKRGQQFQAIGRSRGGLTSKIHAVVDGLGIPCALKSLQAILTIV
jgi:hypothetical protein